MTIHSAAPADWRTSTPTPVPAERPAREPILGAWLREIAGAVCGALDTPFTDAGYLLTLHDDLPTPSHLHAGFRVAGHRVDIDVRWPDPWQAPQYGLRVGNRHITVHDDPTQPPTVTLAHAAWLAILDLHLAAPMRALLAAGTVDGYRLGGGCTGAWDPGYHPSLDPRNWRSCRTCDASTRLGADRCTDCFTAAEAGRDPGSVVARNVDDWAPHPGDIVPLPRLLDRAWRYPTGRTPDAWVDLAGTEWLATTDRTPTETVTGETPPRLRQIFDDLQAGRRNPGPTASRARLDPARWAVAVVDAHH